MKIYTVISDYFATGEGRTISLWIGRAEDAAHAKDNFEKQIRGGDYYGRGAEVTLGIPPDDTRIQMLLPQGTKEILEDPHCYSSFTTQLHFNYS